MVATRPAARRVAGIEPAISTWAMIQPPNTSPWMLASDGCGMTRKTAWRSGGGKPVWVVLTLKAAAPGIGHVCAVRAVNGVYGTMLCIVPDGCWVLCVGYFNRSEEHKSALQSLMLLSSDVFSLK